MTGLTLKVRKRGIESRVKGVDVGGEPKVADFWLTRILTPKKGDTSQDPKTRVSFKEHISNDCLKFWAKYLCFHHDDPRVAAVPESISLLHSYLCM